MYPQQPRRRNIGDVIVKALASYGLTQLTGIPLLMLAGTALLDVTALIFGGLSLGADAAADAIRPMTYAADEAQSIMDYHTAHGATVETIIENEDGTVTIDYNISAYTGLDIEADAFDLLGELF